MGSDRYSRNEALFGKEGQSKIANTKVAILGVGGLGAPVGQQLAYLGTRDFAFVDYDVATDSSLNRLVGAVPADVDAATSKVAVAERTVLGINPDATVEAIAAEFTDAKALAAISRADVVIGCLDRDTQRLELTEIVSRLAKPYFDLASDTSGEAEELWYGGRVIFCAGARCLVCMDELDQRAMALDRMSLEDRAADERIYGVKREALEGTGPAVVSINGVVASLAVTEFMAYVTGLRDPFSKLTYRADLGIVKRSQDEPESGCYYCEGLWGTGVSSTRWAAA